MTGASSFTGYWFARALVSAGHDVTATFTRERGDYSDIRKQRINKLIGSIEPVWSCRFGEEKFLSVVRAESWDVLCHHGAEVENYKSPDFDVPGALLNNTKNISIVVNLLKTGGCNRLVKTGSVFERGEGAGTEQNRAFSAYGLSKELSWRLLEFYAGREGIHTGKFVIPNPFGPYEEKRFTAYLMRCWRRGETAEVSTPEYIRDNIHVDLLALAYQRFVTALPEDPGSSKVNPSGYVETQGEFAKRFAKEISGRLGLTCALSLNPQMDFPEPLDRHNTDPVVEPTWSERAAWDNLADYYREETDA